MCNSRVCLHVGLCMYVTCLSDDNFDSLDVGSSFSHTWYISTEYGSSSYMKVIGSRSRSQQQQRLRKFLFPQCKPLIGNNSASIKHRAMKFACSMGFSAALDQVVWPSLSCDWKWPGVTRCTHSRVVSLRVEGNLVWWQFVRMGWHGGTAVS